MTVPVGSDCATLIMPTDHDLSPAAAQTWLQAAVDGLPAAARLHAFLVADELLTNARQHGQAPYVLRLTTERHRTLVIAVDAYTGGTDATPPGDAPAIVAGLSRRCGLEQRQHARTTWAELELDGLENGLHTPPQPLPRTTRPAGPDDERLPRHRDTTGDRRTR